MKTTIEITYRDELGLTVKTVKLNEGGELESNVQRFAEAVAHLAACEAIGEVPPVKDDDGNAVEGICGASVELYGDEPSWTYGFKTFRFTR